MNFIYAINISWTYSPASVPLNICWVQSLPPHPSKIPVLFFLEPGVQVLVPIYLWIWGNPLEQSTHLKEPEHWWKLMRPPQMPQLSIAAQPEAQEPNSASEWHRLCGSPVDIIEAAIVAIISSRVRQSFHVQTSLFPSVCTLFLTLRMHTLSSSKVPETWWEVS